MLTTIWEPWGDGIYRATCRRVNADGPMPAGGGSLSNVTRAPATGYRSPSHRFATDQGRLDFASVFFDDGKMVGAALYATAASRLRAPKLPSVSQELSLSHR